MEKPTSSATAHFIQPGISRTSKYLKFLHPRTRSFLAGPVLHNTGERFGIEARSANQHAIEFRLRHQPLNVVRLDAAPVQNAQGSRMAGVELLRRTLANKPMYSRSNFRGRGAARTDCPDRFVSYQNTGEFLGGQRADAGLKLALADMLGVPGFAV